MKKIKPNPPHFKRWAFGHLSIKQDARGTHVVVIPYMQFREAGLLLAERLTEQYDNVSLQVRNGTWVLKSNTLQPVA